MVFYFCIYLHILALNGIMQDDVKFAHSHAQDSMRSHNYHSCKSHAQNKHTYTQLALMHMQVALSHSNSYIFIFVFTPVLPVCFFFLKSYTSICFAVSHWRMYFLFSFFAVDSQRNAVRSAAVGARKYTCGDCSFAAWHTPRVRVSTTPVCTAGQGETRGQC